MYLASNRYLAALALIVAAVLLQSQAQVWTKDFDRGEAEYLSKCAACHGVGGKGNGPLATQLKITPSDLTRLAARNGGVFSQSAVIEKIDGRQEVEAHGSRDMPVWGYWYMRGDDAGRRTRQQALIDYLRRIQEK
jgi:mono/diheme cytochrome c family protein